ncbi:MAG TPA: TonB-dependent receptor plug domain-containing protein, partial [Gemmatimonadales bacterium]|nr:TonB-dependent receptor plug domain-containing protein [Gemmatimonadales bacterium]
MRKPLVQGLILVLYAAVPAWGQESAPYPIGEIVVTGQRPPAERITTLRVADSSDLRAVDARTLADALPLLPGVTTRLAAEGVPRIDVRGYRTRHVTLLLDGIPINSTFDGQFDPTLIPAELIERVKLTTGAPSVLYGQGGLGGVLNVVTRRADAPFVGDARLEVRETGAWSARGSAGARRGRWDGFVSGSAVTQDAFPSWAISPSVGAYPAGAARANSGRERYSAFGKVGFAASPTFRLAATGEWLGGDYGVPPSIIDNPADSFAQRPVFERVERLQGGRLQLAASALPTERLSLRAWTFGNWLEDETSRFADSAYDVSSVPGDSGTSRAETASRTLGGQVQLGWSLGRAGRLTAATGVEGDRWEATTFFTPAPSGAGGGGGDGGGGGGGGGGGDTGGGTGGGGGGGGGGGAGGGGAGGLRTAGV